MGQLLAIDLGLRCGLAVYGDDGRLRSYRSTNFGSRRRLKRAVYGVVRDVEGLTAAYAEGDANLAALWEKEAARADAAFTLISAEVWRRQLLLPRQRRTGQDAKATADELAREVIAWSDAPAPTSLRHDAAEAILIGLYGVLELGWLAESPV